MHQVEERGHRRQRKGAVLVALAAVLSLVLPGLDAGSAGAVTAVASDASLTWKVSGNAWTSGSLSPAHATTPPATKDPEDGFVFSQGGGTYDTDSGAASIHFGGSLTLGNTNQGNYRITLANPHLVLAGDGTGHLAADVTWLCNLTFSGCTAGQTQATQGVVVVTLSGVDATVEAGEVRFTVTPDYPPQADQTGQNAGRRQFPQSFLDALLPGLQGHFRDTVTPVPDPNPKAPAPITVSFAVALPTTSTSTTSTSTSTSTTTSIVPPSSTSTVVPSTTSTAAPSTTSTVPPSSTSTSTTVAATSSTTSSTSTTTAPAEDDDVTGGELDWGVKASFRNYITGPIAHGSVTPADGAAANADGTYRFPNGEGSYDSGDDLAVAFDGSVRFAGHDGALDLMLRDPRVTVDGDDGVLVVDVTSRSLSTGATTTYDDLPLADLDLAGITPTTSGGDVTIANVPAVLSTAGAPAFAGFYEAGAALDPVTLHLTVGTATTTTAPGGSTSSSSSSTIASGVGCIDRPSVAAGGTLPVCGTGFLPGEQVQVFLHSTPQLVTVLTADGTGRAAASVTIPATAPPGSHRIELRGVTSGRSLMSGDLTVTAARTGGSGGGTTLPRTGAAILGLLRLALLLVGLGLLVSGGAARVRRRGA